MTPMMRLLALAFRLLAEDVTRATVNGHPIRDSIDFSEWLHDCAKVAESSSDMQTFFAVIKPSRDSIPK